MAEWGFELKSADSSSVCSLAVAWSDANYSASFLYKMATFFSVGEVKIPTVNYLVTWQAELLLKWVQLFA